MRKFIIGVAFGAALVVLALVIVQRTSDTAGTPSPSPTRTAVATKVTPTPGVAAQISAVDRALVQATQTGRAVPVTLVFTERDLTASAAAYFPQTMSGVTRVMWLGVVATAALGAGLLAQPRGTGRTVPVGADGACPPGTTPSVWVTSKVISR